MKKHNKILIVSLFSLIMTGCPLTEGINTTNSGSSSVATSSNINNNVLTSTNSITSSITNNNSNTSSKVEERTLVINPSNFNKISELELTNVVENTEYPEEFTFNSLGVMKSKKITKIKKMVLDVFSTYENLIVYNNYTGTGTPITSQKVTGDNKATYTYTFNGESEFYIVNSSTTHRTHVYSISITYEGNVVSGGGSSSNTGTSSSSSSSNTNNSSSTSNSNVQLSGNYNGTYYSSITTSTNGQTLVKELNKLISSNTENVGYDGLKEAYKTTDVKPGTNVIWDMYSNCSYTAGSSFASSYKKEGDGYNREHSIPQSWFNEASPMKSDIFHVYPTDAYVNNRRGSFPFGEVKSATYTSNNGSKVGSSANSLYSGTVFEPIDEYKGDFARTYFYMATRYMSNLGSWTKGEAQKVFSSEYPYLTKYSVDLFTKWSKQDPVSQKEIDRNNAVYKLQNNRNPFIDHPEFVDVIW